jgi:hypothetical protein
MQATSFPTQRTLLPALTLIFMASSCLLSQEIPSGRVLLGPEQRQSIWNISAGELEGRDLYDKVLLTAYANFLVWNSDDLVDPPLSFVMAVLDDWKRRGNSATPMILALAKDNLDTDLPMFIFEKAEGMNSRYRQIDIQPFVKLARELVDDRLPEINRGACMDIAQLFAGSGGQEDVDRLRRINEIPQVRGLIEGPTQFLHHRLESSAKSAPAESENSSGLQVGHVDSQKMRGWPFFVFIVAAYVIWLALARIKGWMRRKTGH